MSLSMNMNVMMAMIMIEHISCVRNQLFCKCDK